MSEAVGVEIWSAELLHAPSELLNVLGADERRRAEGIADEAVRQRWSTSRAILRTLLGSKLGIEPAAVPIITGVHGKPMLAGDGAHRLHFNLTHSSHHALYAFAVGCDVGIDLEMLGGRRSRSRQGREVAIARRFIGERTAERLHSLVPHQREQELLREWVKHEAVVKCLGLGLGAALDARLAPDACLAPEALPARDAPPAPEALPSPDASPPLHAGPPLHAHPSQRGLALTEIDVGPNAVAALALDGVLGELRRNTFVVKVGSTARQRSLTQ